MPGMTGPMSGPCSPGRSASCPPSAAETFALTGLHPGDDFDVYAAAALAGTTVRQVRRATPPSCTEPACCRLPATDRYGMHDLLRAYATRTGRRGGPDA